MIVIVLTAGAFVAWLLVLLAGVLLDRRERTYRIETLRPAPPLPAPGAHKGVPAGAHPGQDAIRAALAARRPGGIR